MNEFRLVKRSDLPTRFPFRGSNAGLPHARLHKLGNLYFSKAAAEVFGSRKRAVVEYNEDARTLKFIAVDKPPRGLAEKDTFPLNWHLHKGSVMNAWVAVKRLLKFLGLEFTGPANFKVVNINRETHSLVVVLPPAAPVAPNQDEDREADAEPVAGAGAVNQAQLPAS